MHRQVASLLSTSSPGRLAIFGNALGARGVDMVTAGGAEWMHSGPVTLIVRNDWGTGADELEAFAGVMQSEKFPYLVFRTIEVHLKDVPGSLGKAAEAMGDINIYAVTLLETDGTDAVVGLGVRPKRVGDALRRLWAADYTDAIRRRHPNDTGDEKDPDDISWWDSFDDRTERLVERFDKPGRPNDPDFWKR